MNINGAVLYKGEAYDVVSITPMGDTLLRHFITEELIWADYFDIEFADPYADPSALLEALATLGEFDDLEPAAVEDERGSTHETTEARPKRTKVLLPQVSEENTRGGPTVQQRHQ